MPQVEVRRSARRRRTVSAYREGERIIVLVPARLSRAEEQRLVADVVAKLERKRSRGRLGDEELQARARDLSARHFDGRAEPTSVRWVTTMARRWGSCTPVDGTIRLSHRLQEMPDYVRDYVLVHELAHLLVPGHGPDFWELVERYPQTERARGFLEGFQAGSGAAPLEQDEDPTDSDTGGD